MTKAQLRMIQRRQAQVKQPSRPIIVDQADEGKAIGPYAGHKAGKRKRGVSVLKRKPRVATVVTTYLAKDEFGNTLAHVKTLTYRNPE